MTRKERKERMQQLQEENVRLNEAVQALEIEKQELHVLCASYLTMIKNLRGSRQHPLRTKQ